jgi:hypothetical protein
MNVDDSIKLKILLKSLRITCHYFQGMKKLVWLLIIVMILTINILLVIAMVI